MPITDASGNTISGSGSFTFVAEESDLLYRALIKPIRDLDRDQGGLFVKRFLERPQHWVDEISSQINDLPSTDDPATARADLLQYLKDHVGFTRELASITSRLSEANLRKLIGLAVPLWRQKGTSEGLITLARLLTGRSPLYTDWFGFRNILGETLLGEEQIGTDHWVIGGEVTTYDEFTSNLRIMDDGALDEQLLLDLVSLFRPSGERIELALVDFIDYFDQTLDRWQNYGSANIAMDLVNKTGTLPQGANVGPIVPIAAEAALLDCVTVHRFKNANAGFTHNFLFSVKNIGAAGNAPQCYRFQLQTNGNWTLYKEVVAVPGNAPVQTLVTSGSTLPVLSPVPNAFYTMRTQTITTGTAVRIRVWIDSNLIVDYSHAGAVAEGLNAGSFRVVNAAAQPVTIDNVEMFRAPLRFAVVSPSGVSSSANFFA